METLVENAQRILDVAAAADANGPDEFAVLVTRQGGLHILMNQPFRLDAAAEAAGADTAYRVFRSKSGVRVEGRGPGADCMLQSRARTQSRAVKTRAAEWLLDQPLYRITSPLLTSSAAAS